ncbi:hypothetical protein PVL29_017084 [Vitis rotundifolia]|uniref:RNA helicase n=1 Tax=Vitis rotundifolia TaxID=103349 RepID=A0AA38Z9W3_VITRO|nr:hypothetical protein PVL29_017084 [Vitis rotundifolia]
MVSHWTKSLLNNNINYQIVMIIQATITIVHYPLMGGMTCLNLTFHNSKYVNCLKKYYKFHDYLLFIFIFPKLPLHASMSAAITRVHKGCFALVTKVARMLAAKTMEPELEQKSCTVMALLDGGMLKRHKSWLKAEPPTIVVATVRSLCQMLEKQIFKLESMRVLLLTSYSSTNNRQTIFSSASIPQHRRFLHDCIQQKWTKRDVVHVHVNPIEPMRSSLHHRFVICNKYERRHLLSLLHSDAPKCGIIFVGEQVNAAYYSNSGNAPSATLLVDFLKTSYGGPDILLLEEDMNFNLRAASLSEVRQRGGYLLISTDIAARGVDLPETTHIYNFDLPRTVKCCVTNIITSEERFVLQRYDVIITS